MTGHTPVLHERTLHALEYPKVLEHLGGFCVSSAGKEAALALRPMHNIEDITHAARLHEDCRTWHCTSQTPTKRDGAAFRMSFFPDIAGMARYLQSSVAVLDMDALWALREVLHLTRQAVLSITQPQGEAAWPHLWAFVARTPLPQHITEALHRCLNDDGQLKDASSPELYHVRTELRRLHQGCIRKVKDFAQEYNILHYLQDEFMTLASDRYVLPLKANFKGRLQGIIHDWSQTGETCYFEPLFLVEINNRLQELKRQEREAERKILIYLTNLVRNALPAVQAAAALLVRLDVLLAQGRLAEKMGDAHCVTLDASQGIHLLGARHPLLALSPQGAHPVDVHLQHAKYGLIISGGNAGGKTVCLKTLGLMALMAQTGLPIPVEKGSYMPLWQHIHAFIGDEQSLDDNVSTFTAQIQHLSKIWEYADATTLILLDEFGTGTDPTQGAALAQAVLDSLMERHVTVIAATHFPALKTYALTHAHARAASVLFDPNTKKPLFRLAYDQVGASQALDVAREHGLPESILRRAEQYLLLDGEDSAQLITRLNTLAVEREKEIAALKVEQERQKEKRRQHQERFEQERKKLHEDVRHKAQELMAAWKAGKQTHKQALREMAQLRASIATPPTQEHSPIIDIGAVRVGLTVLHRPFQKQATVTEVDARRQKVRLAMQGVTLWADIKDMQNISS